MLRLASTRPTLTPPPASRSPTTSAPSTPRFVLRPSYLFACSSAHSWLLSQVAFIAIFIFFFASTWGPGAWVLIGEIFPLPIRSRGVALSTASNWLWNTIIAVITPYMVGEDKGNLRSSVFFIWGGLCTCAFVYSYFLVPETKGLTLEQVDQMFEAGITPRKSAAWRPDHTYATQMGKDNAEIRHIDSQEEEHETKKVEV